MATASEFPEIVFGLIAPIGTDLNLLHQKLKDSLNSMQYTSHMIKLIESIPEFKKETAGLKTLFEISQKKIDLGTRYRESSKRSDVFAGVAVKEIQNMRSSANTHIKDENEKKIIPLSRTAYILKQLKTRKEVVALRSTYGQGLYLISAYSSYKKRKAVLSRNLGNGISTKETDEQADKLIEKDEKEEGKGEFGQQLRETFPEGDFFLNMDTGEKDINNSIRRFVDLIFGITRTPTKQEYGMFHAYGTAVTSSALARQVGASIATPKGEVILDGSNEVPKPDGGVYWDEDENKEREYELGYDINQRSQKKVFMEVAEALQENNLIAEQPDESWWDKVDHKALLLDRLELSRTVHAEMAALMTAARLGVKVQDCTLYSTTFPCHNCAKHIVAAGLKEVIYIEPYPKSLTGVLYLDSIAIDEEVKGKVPFRPFIGVSPVRYIDLFAMRS